MALSSAVAGWSVSIVVKGVELCHELLAAFPVRRRSSLGKLILGIKMFSMEADEVEQLLSVRNGLLPILCLHNSFIGTHRHVHKQIYDLRIVPAA